MATLLLVIIYIAFISLGLPDALLGAAWPVIQSDLGVPYSTAGALSMIVGVGTILASVFSSRIAQRFGTGKVTAVSVGLTASGLIGFAFAPSVVWFVLAALPLGFGAGAVDAGLNAYVADNYESRHMSWLHSFWGLGALLGPLVLSTLIADGVGWRSTYLGIGGFQIVLFIVLLLSVPLWIRVASRSTGTLGAAATGAGSAVTGAGSAVTGAGAAAAATAPKLGVFSPLKIPGVWKALVTFFLYCAIESTMGLWGGSFLFKVHGMDPAQAAGWVSAYFAAITAGRFLTGFVTRRMSNNNLILAGGLVVLLGVVLMLLPLPLPLVLAGFLLIGLGCAPIFPCMIHETPVRFGRHGSQAVMGFQMATAYVGVITMPPLFGLIGEAVGLGLMPIFLLFYVIFMLLVSQSLRTVRAEGGVPQG